MPDQNGINKQAIPVIPIAPGEAHLQNKVSTDKCYICHKKADNNMALLRVNGKEMAMACLTHPGVVQEFIRQFRVPPLGWKQEVPKKE